MKSNPSHFSRTAAGKDAIKDMDEAKRKRLPVESVSWDDCQEFVKRLNEMTREDGWEYRLPTLAQWQYACRGGELWNKDAYGFDFYFDRPTNTLLPDRANFNNTVGRTREVGSYLPNRLGLYDMHGNVSEWCDDAQTDAEGNVRRMTHGGGWRHPAEWCRAVFLIRSQAFARFNDCGLRVARVPSGKTATK